jgi:hopanoid biosynthesis associated protein HpnK
VKRLIITADDFGRSQVVNEAIEQAHIRGILTTASLMVGEAATADAVTRARRHPGLRVGLHLVLVDGRPLLAPAKIPVLAGPEGRFRDNLVWAGFAYFFRPAARRQLEAELRVQFEAFRQTGLPLDHVNAHHHLHLHPTVLGTILKVGRDYGLGSVRLPHEPFWPAWRATREGLLRRLGLAALLAPWAALMRIRLNQARLRYNDYLFGMNDTGRMTPDRVRRFIACLPEGFSEIHLHPAGREGIPGSFETDAEFLALTAPATVEALRRAGLHCTGFGDLAPTEKCRRK